MVAMPVVMTRCVGEKDHLGAQIEFGVVTKEARIARNARRILQYLLNNLSRGQANTVESIIRCRS